MGDDSARAPAKKGRGAFGIIVAVGLSIIGGFILFGLFSPSPEKPPAGQSSTSQPAQPSSEFILATLDRENPRSDADPSLARYRFYLKTLEAKTGSTQNHIADVVVRTQEMLRKEKKIEQSLLQILRAFDASLPEGARVKIEEVAAAYVMLMKR